MQTKLRQLRWNYHLTLREIAERIGVSIPAVESAERKGIRTPRAAAKYATAFPGKTWLDLIDAPSYEQ